MQENTSLVEIYALLWKSEIYKPKSLNNEYYEAYFLPQKHLLLVELLKLSLTSCCYWFDSQDGYGVSMFFMTNNLDLEIGVLGC